MWIPAASYRNAGPTASSSPGADAGQSRRRADGRQGPPGSDAWRERLCRGGVRLVLPEPDRRATAHVPPAWPAPRPGDRLLCRRRAGECESYDRPPTASRSCTSIICSLNRPPDDTGCMTCFANTPAPSPPRRAPATTKQRSAASLDFYLHTAVAAGKHIPQWPFAAAASGPWPTACPQANVCLALARPSPGWKPIGPTCTPPRTYGRCWPPSVHDRPLIRDGRLPRSPRTLG